MNEINETIELLKNKATEADKVLIGIGKEFEEDIECADKEVAGFLYLDSKKDENVLDAYAKLYDLIKDKDYQVISLCMDDRIYDVFPEERVVTPCGNTKYLQCVNNCNGELINVDDRINPILEKIKSRANIGNEDFLRCPKCGAHLVVNNILAPAYNEEGYLARFAEYKKWLQTTINKKLLMLELGAGMRFPTVIRLPFDKMCYYNQKCSFFRVHETLYQHTAENKDRGISVKSSAIEFLKLL